ncbi:MAG: MFS transporter, partial [Promicromonosporaceae bacterium]|nr:MFS transporter [Promicromonosporaceae bacterium]
MPKSQDVQGNDVLGWAFTKLWSATAFSNLADGILKTAAPLAAVRLTDSPLLLGGLAAALYLPWLLFSLPAGVIADRADRRKVMLAGQAVRIIVATLVTLAFVTDIASIYLLYVAAFLIGTAEVLYDITAQAILPQVVSKKALSKANARQQGVEIATNQFIGPPLGGLMVGASVALAMGVPAALWVLAFGLLAWMPGRYRPQRIIATGGDTPAVSNWRARLYADVREGLGYLFRHRILRTLALMTGLANLATAATGAVFVLFAVGADS